MENWFLVGGYDRKGDALESSLNAKGESQREVVPSSEESSLNLGGWPGGLCGDNWGKLYLHLVTGGWAVHA